MKKTLYLGLVKLSLVAVFIALALIQFKQEKAVNLEAVASTKDNTELINNGDLLLDKNFEAIAAKKVQRPRN